MVSSPISRRAMIAGALTVVAASPGVLGAAGGQEDTGSGLRWRSGACDGQSGNVSGGGFGAWRGQPSTYARIWADASLKDMREVWMMNGFLASGWEGTLDVACGGPRDGQTWRSAAKGRMDDTWRSTCRAVRRKWGELAEVHLSMAHEMNGSWYPWSVTSETVADFKKAWTRWYGIVHEELVARGYRAKVCLSMTAETLSDVGVQDIAPEPEHFDLVGCDYYSMWPDLVDDSVWEGHRHATGVGGSPRGVQAWFDYARTVGKPLTFPEWGLNPESRSDNPFFIERMRGVFAVHGCTDPSRPGAGQLAGEAYFNESVNCRLWPSTQVPAAARRYRRLSWGR